MNIHAQPNPVTLPEHRDLFYGGSWHVPAKNKRMGTINPSTGESLGEVIRPLGTEVVMVQDDQQCRLMLEIRHEAFGEPGAVTDADVARARSTVQSGGVAALVVDSTNGESVASGACLVPYDQVTELTSIGVRPAWRHHGIGADGRDVQVGHADLGQGGDALLDIGLGAA